MAERLVPRLSLQDGHPLQLGHTLVCLLHVGAQRGEIGRVGIRDEGGGVPG